ncbi:MAG: hypothetical protein KDH16_22880 [Rhodocyclaceae bacterium]|nr:hypothetical protein [Rhodocyclaceae bacterium]
MTPLEKLVDILPPKIRKVVYVVAGVALVVIGAIPVVKAALADGFQLSDLDQILGGITGGGALLMAAANTKVS